jgi:hypothetical protein
LRDSRSAFQDQAANRRIERPTEGSIIGDQFLSTRNDQERLLARHSILPLPLLVVSSNLKWETSDSKIYEKLLEKGRQQLTADNGQRSNPGLIFPARKLSRVRAFLKNDCN